MLFLLATQIPDWKSRYDFWLQTAKTLGGMKAALASIALSPYFDPALLIGAIAWLLVVGDSQSRLRHPVAKLFGWTAVLVIGALVVWVAGSGIFELKVREAAAGRFLPERHLTLAQRDALTRGARQFMSEEKLVPLDVWAVTTPESTGYAIEISKALQTGGMQINSLNAQTLQPMPITALDTSVRGLDVAVTDPANPPALAVRFQKVLDGAGLRTKLSRTVGIPSEGFVLLVKMP